MKKATILFIITVLSLSAFCQSDIDMKMSLLEQNVKNSEKNFNQFRENLSISVKNFNEATRVVNELRKLKKQAVRDTKRSSTNALVYGQVIEKYNDFIASEKSNILREEEAVTKLENLILKIKENSEARQQLVSSYTVEIQKAEAEVGVWSEKQREVASVIEDIDEREVGALDERKKWMSKKEVYKKETKKWSGELKNSKKTLLTFEKIRD